MSELERRLSGALAGEVGTGPAVRAMYSTDASNYRHPPLAVVAPRSVPEVLNTLRITDELHTPVLPRGAGTSIGGQAVNTAVLLDFTRHLNRIRRLDPDSRVAEIEPGLVLDTLRSAAAPHGLTFGPDPSTHNRCTLGGMIGNNACGSHSVAWGKTDDNVRSLDVALRDGTRFTAGPTSPEQLRDLCARDDRVGEVYRAMRRLVETYGDDIRAGFPNLRRRVSGYNLPALLPENGFNLARALVGSEGTCVTVLGATVDLVRSPASRALAVLGFDDSFAAADAVPALDDLSLLTMEGIDQQLVTALRARRGDNHGPALPEGTGWLYLETGGDTPAEAEAIARDVAARAPGLGASSLVVTDPRLQRELWRIREDGAGLASRLADGSEAWSGWEDSAVPPQQLGSYLREFAKLMARHGRSGVPYGHFGDGCLHIRIDFPLTEPDGPNRYRAFLEEAADLAVAHGGSLSGEHGDGQARGELLDRMYPPRILEAFRAFKEAFDPTGGMNPHRLVDPAPLDADLRPVVAPAVLPTRSGLALHADGGDLAAASRRCVGVGKCLSGSGGVMCPSYRATGAEQNSTRGRARLLSEMLAGDIVQDGWRSPELRSALDLCLGCKGCKTDCPVGVDMAAYKVEFLSRYYHRRPRPVAHYSMGELPRLLRAMSAVPRAFNRVAGSRAAPLLMRLAGLAPQRRVPPVAGTTLQQWFRRRTPAATGTPMMLWPDTFSNYFDPQVGADAVRVSEHLGFRVHLPTEPVCCGLTWYSTGRLRAARTVLRRTLDVLEPWLERGMPIVGLEPSCTAMLRHDAAELLPHDPRVPKLAAAVKTFAEHLYGVSDLPVTHHTGQVLTQVHCHQYADLGFQADRALLDRIAEEVTVLDGGCCGLAGNFGFERGHYDISTACAEQQLLPALRSASESTLVHADGFSCRTQIRELGRREPLHLASLAARALGLAEPGDRLSAT